jgi:hypothetical protein
MCDFCRQHPCDVRCPNAPEPAEIELDCGCTIEEGDFYYDINDFTICEDCLRNTRREFING